MAVELIKQFIRSPLRKWLKHFPTRPLVLSCILIGYSIAGGFMFCWLEKDNDLKNRQETYSVTLKQYNDRVELREYILDRLKNLAKATASEAAKLATLDSILQGYEQTIGVAVPPKPQESDTVWDIWGGMFYAGTIYTTIGYGSIYAVTPSGRVATMVYALVGIPLTLTLLNDLGKLLFRMFRTAWKYSVHLLACAIPKVTPTRRFSISMKEKFEQHFGYISIATQGTEDEPDNLPFTVALFLLVLWICISAAIFNLIQKDWTFFESFYFFFISLTTIGLGDLVPSSNPIIIVFVITGLSVVTVCINVVQAKVEAFFKSLLARIERERLKRLNKLAQAKDRVAVDVQTDDEDEVYDVEYITRVILKDAPFYERILYNSLLPEREKTVLEEKVVEMNTRSIDVQTDSDWKHDVYTQTGEKKVEEEEGHELDTQTHRLSRPRPFYKPMYIYHVND